MHSRTGLAHIVLALYSLQLLGGSLAASIGTYSKCYTKLSSKSTSNVPTTSRALTITWPRVTVVTKTPVSTATPLAQHTTVTSTATSITTTTLPQVTDTYTAFDTSTTTSTETADTFTTTVVTSTTTTTTVTGTTTIPVSSGFLPVQSTLPGSAAKAKREAIDNHSPRLGNLSRRAASPPQCRKGSKVTYPAAVTCLELVIGYTTIVQTKTASKTLTTTLAPSTITSTIVTTTILTSTTAPIDASTTVSSTLTMTVDVTSTPTTTVTQTSTLTATVQAPTATYYAACGPSNIAGTINGYGINLADGSQPSVYITGDTTAYDCCVSCINNPSCTDAAFANRAGCSLQTNGLCAAPGQFTLTADVNQNLPPDGFVFLSNGNCGAYRVTDNVLYRS